MMWQQKKTGHYLLLQLIENELNDDVVLEAQDLRDSLGDPRFDDF